VHHQILNFSIKMTDPNYDPVNAMESSDPDATSSPSSGDNAAALRSSKSLSKATTTPLVRHVFKELFREQLEENILAEGSGEFVSCGICSNCLRNDCGECQACLQGELFGGDGGGGGEDNVCRERLCLQQDIVELSQESPRPQQARSRSNGSVSTTFLGDPVKVKDGTKFYSTVEVNGTTYNVGNFVLISPDVGGTAYFVAKIIYLADDGHDRVAHVQHFCRGIDTVLGRLGDDRELYAVQDCEDVDVVELTRRVRVKYRPAMDATSYLDFYAVGGTTAAVIAGSTDSNFDGFWYRHSYNPKCARFTRAPEPCVVGTSHCTVCRVLKKSLDKSQFVSRLGSRCKDGVYLQHDAFSYNGDTFRVGDSVLLDPEAYHMPHELPRRQVDPPKRDIVCDERVFTEYFRHARSRVKGSNEGTVIPFRVAIVERIAQRISRDTKNEPNQLELSVRKLYRPENTAQGARRDLTFKSDIEMLFWSSDLIMVPAARVVGKCFVRPKQTLTVSPEKWVREGYLRNTFDRLFENCN
jgi:hypothetical protein